MVAILEFLYNLYNLIIYTINAQQLTLTDHLRK